MASTSPLPITMSQDDAGPLSRLQVAIDILGEQESVQEAFYLDACEALKQVHSLSKLYKVKYYTFTAHMNKTCVSAMCTSIMTRDDADPRGDRTGDCGWMTALARARLPHDLSRMPMNKPYQMTEDKIIVVTEVVPYLKRSREDEQQ